LKIRSTNKCANFIITFVDEGYAAERVAKAHKLGSFNKNLHVYEEFQKFFELRIIVIKSFPKTHIANYIRYSVVKQVLQKSNQSVCHLDLTGYNTTYYYTK